MINVTQANHNLDFLARAAAWLVNDDDIISIRSKQPRGIIPLIVIIAGIIFASQRRKRSKYAEKVL